MSWVKEELFCRIRHDAAFEGLSIRALARKHGVHRRLVREALSSPQPKPRRPPVRRSPRLDPFKKTIDEWLRADLEAPHKQRHTAKRIRSRLAEEFDAEVPYPTVRDYVTARRPQIAVEAGAPLDGFIIRHNRPGADAEVDFGEVMVRLDGALTRCHLFAFRLAYSGLAVHRVTVSCGQEAFFEGHEYAFGVIGGVPVGQIRYDNLTAAVRRVIFRSRSRVENPRWEAFRRYYGFTAFYCQAGPEGAHEKGGVEGQVGYYRRNRLTPVPEVASLAQLNERLEAADLADRNRKIKMRSGCIGEDFAVEASLLGPLPEEPFAAGLTLRPRVDLPTIRGQCAELVARAERDHLSYRGLLAELLMAECDERDRRRSERRLHAAGFPRPKSLSDFDFAANSNVNAALVNTLATCEWVRVGQPLCLIGDSGTGKSHLLIGLGSAAAMVRPPVIDGGSQILLAAADRRQRRSFGRGRWRGR